jgi:glycosyltransferase
MKISIITVVRNNKKFIESCVRSVLRQTYKDIEYIIIDGASTDGTLDILDRYKDSVSKIISGKDAGHIYAMNKGIAIAGGDVIAFLHSDDLYAADDVVEKVVSSFGTNHTDSVYGDLVYVRREDPVKIIRYWRSGGYNREKIKRGWMPPHPAFFVKKKVYEKYGLFDTSFRISMDYESVLRLLYKYKISVFYLPQVIVMMRLGGVSNRGPANIIKKSVEDYRACRMYGLGAPTVIMKNISKLPQFFGGICYP